MKEQSLENIMKNRKIFEPPRYMRTHQAADQLLQIIAGKEVDSLSLSQDTLCVACVRLGTAEQSNRLMSLKGALLFIPNQNVFNDHSFFSLRNISLGVNSLQATFNLSLKKVSVHVSMYLY